MSSRFKYTPLAFSLLALQGLPALAEDAATPVTPAPLAASVEDTQELEAITVKATMESEARASSPKYTEALLDTPKSITVVSQEVMQEQGVTSLREALKNVSGIAMAAGEGGVPAGDNLTIRGFSARTDLFVDGVRDFGGYTRDTFNLEKIEVVKGPSSAYTGRGSTGGSVNMVSKAPTLDDFVAGQLAAGTDELGRATLDVNKAVGESTAVRLNLMGHTQDMAGRDVAEANRWGVAPSIAFGLDTDTRLTLSAVHLQQDNIPDYGHPFLNGRPVVVKRENFYGIDGFVYEDTVTDIVTAIIEKDFTDAVSLRNTTRWGRAERDSIINAPRTPNVAANTVTLQGKARDSRDEILSNQTDASIGFSTGTLQHTVVTGVEVVVEDSHNNARTIADRTGFNLQNPDNNDPFRPAVTPAGTTDAESTNHAAYIFDTIKLNEKVSISGGLRYDHFEVDYDSTTAAGVKTALKSNDDILSYEAGVVFKPAENGSIYLSYGTSANPSAEGLSLQQTAGVSTGDLAPEEAETYELGTKWRLLGKKLALTAAVFRTDKSNVKVRATNTDPFEIVGEQRVDGFELGLTGNITDKWQVITSYTYLDSETRASKNPLEVGKELPNVAEQSFNLWSTYHLNEKLQVGAGAQFLDDRFSNTTNTNQVPDYLTFDAMLGYHLSENVDVALNVYNLEDKKYYDQLGGGHAVPGMARMALLSTTFKF